MKNLDLSEVDLEKEVKEFLFKQVRSYEYTDHYVKYHISKKSVDDFGKFILQKLADKLLA